jgi:hypothetical protein
MTAAARPLLWNVAGRSELDFLDTATGKVTRGPKLPLDTGRRRALLKDGSMLALSGSGATKPGDIYTVDVATGKVTQRTRSAHEGVDLARLVQPDARHLQGA